MDLIIKEDINFLGYPNWVVSTKKNVYSLVIKQANGFYEIKSPEGLPTRFDKLILYYLLIKLHSNPALQNHIVTTRYEIAKNVLFQKKNFSKTKYDRIMLALKRWKSIYMRFEGTFFEQDSPNATVKYFSIIDYVSLDKKTNALIIKFNDLYINQLKNTNFYRIIPFDEYKRLTRPVSARLYEILIHSLSSQELWCIDVTELGERLTLEKVSYPSHIVAAIKPAIADINKNTEMAVDFEYYKARCLCLFRKKR